MNVDLIPADLRSLPRWLCWRLETRKGKITKVPYCVRTGGPGSSTDPSKWCTFDEALQATGYDGIGFCFGEGLMGVDLDGVRDPQTSAIADWAVDVVESLDSYTEISPSGTGLHVILRGSLPPGRRQVNGAAHRGFGLYDTGRYFTVTGVSIRGNGIIPDRQQQLEEVFSRLFPPAPPRPQPPPAASPSGSDTDLIERIRRSKNGAKFDRLWAGSWEGDYASQSEADEALCCVLAFWTQRDAARIDSLFRQSGLMREKWDRDDYRERTIARAIDATTETWKPRPSRANSAASAQTESKPPHIAARVRSADEILALELEAPSMLIPGLLAKHGATLVIGAQKSNKTVLMAQAGIAVATGQALMQFYRILDPGPVLFIEQDDPGGEASIQDFLKHSPIPTKGIPFFTADKVSMYLGPAFNDWLEAEIVAKGLRFVVLDSYTALRPHRSGGADLVKLERDELSSLDELAKRLRCCFALVHHESQGSRRNTNWSDRSGGTYAMTAATEGMLSVCRFGEFSSTAPERLVRTRFRHDSGTEFVMRFREPTLDHEWVMEGAASEFYPLVLQLRTAFGCTAFSPKDLYQEMGISRATAHRQLDRLSYSGIVRKVGTGEYVLSA